MQLFINEKLLSMNGKFFIFDEKGNDMYEAVGRLVSIGRQLTVFDMSGKEVLFIKQKIMSVHHTYYITPAGEKEIQLVQKIVSITPRYYCKELGWTVKGNVIGHEYEICHGKQLVAAVTHKILSFEDKFAVHIANDSDTVNVLGIVLAVECSNKDNIVASYTSPTVQNA